MQRLSCQLEEMQLGNIEQEILDGPKSDSMSLALIICGCYTNNNDNNETLNLQDLYLERLA